MIALIKTLQVILALGILVLIHEFGHFVFAKIFGIRVDKFFLFFDAGGFRLFSTRSKWFVKICPKAAQWETEYGIGWLPLGGYMLGAMVCAMVLKHVRRPWYILSFSLVIGGGVGNLIDRIFNDGNVIDFIDVRIINFAIFNFADICAVCGGILLCVLVIIDEVRDVRKKKAEKASVDDNAESTEEVTEDGQT